VERLDKQINNRLEKVGKNGLTRAWKSDFQLATIKANTFISLFPTTLNIEEYMEIDEACTNPTMTTLIVIWRVV
jgi:hypothetical protein